MPWRTRSVMDERVEFVMRASREQESISSLCREYDISRPTGYLWLQRYLASGTVEGLQELSRRPHTSPSKTSDDIERQVVALRRQWGWGAKKLQILLDTEGLNVPIITINRIIKRNGLIPPERKVSQHVQRFERSNPNELWQMDFKGEYRVNKRKYYPLTILDDHSRYVVGLYGLSSMQGALVKRCLVEAFQTHGLPDALLMDHGSPWWGTGGDVGLSKLSVALIKMGVRLVYSGFSHPQTQGKIERFHRTLAEEIYHRGTPNNACGWAWMLKRIRHDYNNIRPHEALAFKTPAQIYKNSSRSYCGYLPWIYPSDLTVTTVYDNGHAYIGNKQYFVSNALAGEEVGIKRVGQKLYVYFRYMLIREINATTGQGVQLIDRRNCKVCPDTQCKA